MIAPAEDDGATRGLDRDCSAPDDLDEAVHTDIARRLDGNVAVRNDAAAAGKDKIAGGRDGDVAIGVDPPQPVAVSDVDVVP